MCAFKIAKPVKIFKDEARERDIFETKCYNVFRDRFLSLFDAYDERLKDLRFYFLYEVIENTRIYACNSARALFRLRNIAVCVP